MKSRQDQPYIFQKKFHKQWVYLKWQDKLPNLNFLGELSQYKHWEIYGGEGEMADWKWESGYSL